MISVADQRLIQEDLYRFRYDPKGYVLWAFPWGKGVLEKEYPKKWQLNYLDRLSERIKGWAAKPQQMLDKHMEAAGNGNGKSALLAWILKWGVDTFPMARGFLTAGTEDQLLRKTMPEVNKWHQLSLTRFNFELTATAYFNKLHKMNWRMDIQAWNKSNPESGAGLHNKGSRLMKLFDEASQIPKAVWDTAKGADTDTFTEIIHHNFGNPTRNSGEFFEGVYGDKMDFWHHHHLDCRTVEGANMALYQSWIDEYGEDSDFVRVHVLGLPPRSSSMQFILTEYFNAASYRRVEWAPDDPLVVAVDVARGGEDFIVIRFRLGNDMRTFPPIRIPGSEMRDLTKLKTKVFDIFQHPLLYGLPRKPDAIVVDANGLGAGLYDDLKNLKYPVYEFIASQASPDKYFANMRAYAWAQLRNAMKFLAAVDVDDEYLLRDIRNQESTLDAHDRTILVRKEIMKKDFDLPSPDDGDAAAMLWAFPIPRLEKPRNVWEKGVKAAQGTQKPYSLTGSLNKRHTRSRWVNGWTAEKVAA